MIGKVALETFIHKNFDGLTPFHIVRRLPTDESREIKKIFDDTGASEIASLVQTITLPEFLSSREYIFQKLVKVHVFLQKGLSEDAHSALLVVAVFIVTVTYQGILSPPGGLSYIGDDNKNG